MPRFTLSTMMFCTLVVAMVTAVCMSLRVTDFSASTPTKRVVAPNGKVAFVPFTEYTPIGTHPPTGTELVVRLSWALPIALVLTFGTVWLVRKWHGMPRRQFMRIAIPTLVGLSLANIAVGLVYYYDKEPGAIWFQAALAGSLVIPLVMFASRIQIAKSTGGGSCAALDARFGRT